MGHTALVCDQPMWGRFVRVRKWQVKSTIDVLTLCEVEIYSSDDGMDMYTSITYNYIGILHPLQTFNTFDSDMHACMHPSIHLYIHTYIQCIQMHACLNGYIHKHDNYNIHIITECFLKSRYHSYIHMTLYTMT